MIGVGLKLVTQYRVNPTVVMKLWLKGWRLSVRVNFDKN